MTLSSSIHRHAEIIYFTPQTLTVGPNFTIESTGYVDFFAGEKIVFQGPFLASLGAEMDADIDPNIGILQHVGHEGWIAESRPVRYGEEHRDQFRIHSVYPNPSNPANTITFFAPFPERALILVYDLLGREVLTEAVELSSAGRQEVRLDLSSLSSGTYIFRIGVAGVWQRGTFTVVK